jgi:syntaxin 1B/2/3
MSRDRLADLRAQKGGSDSELLLSDYSTPAQRHRPPNPYAQRDQYEMSNVGGPVANAQRGGEALAFGGDMTQFYTEIGAIHNAIAQYSQTVEDMEKLHEHVLNNADDPEASHQVEALTGEINELGKKIIQRIKYLREHVGGGPDGEIRTKQTQSVQDSFKKNLELYHSANKTYRDRLKKKVERRLRIVKPDATPEEIQAAVNGEGNAQIFSQALLSSNRLGESRAAYKEVQQRNADIKEIGRTMEVVLTMIDDMSALIEQQDTVIHAVHDNYHKVAEDTEAAVGTTDKALFSAIAYRKKRWICFFLLLVILVIVAIVLATQLPPLIRRNNNNNNSNNGVKTVTQAATSIAASPTA